MDNIHKASLKTLIKAVARLKKFSLNINTDQEKAGVIQAFEYSFELLWKTIKRFSRMYGLNANSPRDAFRIGAQLNFISDPDIFFIFLKKRNLTTHTYNEQIADEIVNACPNFIKEVEKVIEKLENAL